MKACSCCGLSLPLESFSVDRAKPDGLRTKCRSCTSAQRKASRPHLAENIAKQKAEYAAKNRDKLRAYHKSWRDKNNEALNAQVREYRAGKREHFAKLTKEWCIKNADKVGPRRRAFDAKGKALKLGCMPAWANENKIHEAYVAADILMQVTGEWYEVDHIVPMQGATVSGLHWEGNLQVLTRAENRSKGIRWWPNMPE